MTEELCWKLFKETGKINYYLLYSALKRKKWLEDLEVTGIVLSAMPYKEKDKLVYIFTVELGLITGILKGVSAPKAKL